jgi:hypothetical protein
MNKGLCSIVVAHHSHPVVSVHLLSSAVVHCLLLLLQLTKTLFDGNTLGNATVVVFTLLGMNT